MGWRVGYLAYPKFNGDTTLESELVKVQDTVVICASQIGQHLALACLAIGRKWVDDLVLTLERKDAPMSTFLHSVCICSQSIGCIGCIVAIRHAWPRNCRR